MAKIKNPISYVQPIKTLGGEYNVETVELEDGTSKLVLSSAPAVSNDSEITELEKILAADTREYTYKAIFLMYGGDDTSLLDFAEAYATSDGAFYESGEITHTWDKSKDKPHYNADGEEIYSTRYVVAYNNTAKITIGTNFIIANSVFRIVGDVKHNGTVTNNERYCPLKSISTVDGSNTNFSKRLFARMPILESIKLTNVASSISYSFSGCTSLKSIEIDGDSIQNFDSAFSDCCSLEETVRMNYSNATTYRSMYSGCINLKIARPLNAINSPVSSSFTQTFSNCTSLHTIELMDFRGAIGASNVFSYCTNLINLNLKNIPVSMTIGSGTSWGHKLTLDSLTNTIKELWDLTGGTSQTLTVGSANLTKLANIYVKLIDITEEMRAEDEYIDLKKPFEVCEGTDEGAMLITEYVTSKNWQLA